MRDLLFAALEEHLAPARQPPIEVRHALRPEVGARSVHQVEEGSREPIERSESLLRLIAQAVVLGWQELAVLAAKLGEPLESVVVRPLFPAADRAKPDDAFLVEPGRARSDDTRGRYTSGWAMDRIRFWPHRRLRSDPA